MAEVGRKTKMTEDKTDLAIELAKQGNSITQICKLLKIDRGTYYLWCKEAPELKELMDRAIQEAKENEIKAIRKSLIKRAKGYKTKETKEVYDSDGELLQTTITTKEIPGDVKAQQFYLTNNDPDNWKLQPEENKSNENTDNRLVIEIEGLEND